ncbi:efflux RND transporter permease subunit [Archangium gephyra]|uniref:efflux RND transporter permease subunit n=1 Tax=Archangium gephyra TaxID=48 RepID=UPI003B7EF561
MNLTELSVRRPVTGVMVFLCLTILGVFTFSRLKLDMLPDIEFPLVAIITEYPGAGPDSIEQLVTRPIEAAMASVENVEDINSTSQQGTSLVMVKFAWGTNMQTAEQDVRKNLEIFAQDVLPEDVRRSLTFAFDPALQPVVFLTVNAPGTPHSVRTLAEDMVEPYLARIEGVASAEVIGGTKREIQVRLKPEWLEAYGISAQQVVASLRGANVMIPGGMLRQGRQELNISTNAEFQKVEQVREVVVGQKGGQRVHLRDVADVVDTFEEEASVVRADGRHAVMMAVRKQSDANTVQVARRVIKELEGLQKRMPEGVTLVRVFDQGLPITRALSNLSDSAVLSILLTAAVLLAFLRSWRTSSIVLVSIPLSLLATFAVMDFQGVTMNIISMAGLALAVGMLVDNSIVVLENIFTHLGRGKGPKEAAIDGTREMAMPIAASTLTTVAVFAPILFVPGLAGQLFRDMSLTICISLLASLLVALTLVPLMASLMALNAGQNRLERSMARLTAWLDPLSERYARVLGRALRHRGKVLGATLLVFIAIMGLSPLLGVDFMPKTDNGELRFSVKANPGTSLWTTDELFKQVEAIVHEQVPEAEVVVSQFGGGEGFAALFGQNSYTGSVQVRLPPRSERERSQQEIEEALKEHFKGLAGLEVLPQQQGLAGAGGDVVVKVFGDDLMKVRAYGARLKSRLETMPGTANVTFSMEQGQPELKVELDREQIKLLGLAPAEVASTVSTYFLGTTATMFREDGDEYRVFVRAPREVREDLRRLRALPVSTPLGVTVPLETVAGIEQALGPTAIARENQRRLATINLSSAKGVALGTLIQRVNETIAAEGEEPGISTVVAGTAEDLADSFMALGLAFVVAVVLVYMVMASQFESLLEPFVILFSVPLAVAGVVLALVVSKTTMQVTALIGIILLAGVVVNNGIVLIDVLKTRRLEGHDLVLAAMEAGRSRLRPILMTTLTTVLGMVPLAFELGDGAEMWAPMARGVIGGMTVSTLLTLLVIPVAYVSLAGWVDRRRARKAGPVAVVPPVEEELPRPASTVG